MIEFSDKNKNSLEFVVNEVKEICLNRNYEDAAAKCNMFLLDIEKLSVSESKEKISNLINSIYLILDELKFTIDAEIRYTLFPLPDIKQETYEIGKKYMKNFLEWIQDKENYTAEKIMGILEDEDYRLEEMKEVLEKIEHRLADKGE